MRQQLIAYSIIFGTSLAAYAGTGAWVIAIATLGLLALSYAEKQGLLRRAAEFGDIAVSERSFATSIFNAVCATGAAYAFGLFMRLL